MFLITAYFGASVKVYIEKGKFGGFKDLPSHDVQFLTAEALGDSAVAKKTQRGFAPLLRLFIILQK